MNADLYHAPNKMGLAPNSYYKSGVLLPVTFPIKSEELTRDENRLWLQQETPESPMDCHIVATDGKEVVIPKETVKAFFNEYYLSPPEIKEDLVKQILDQRDIFFRRQNIDLFAGCFAIDEAYSYYIFLDKHSEESLLDGTPCLYWDNESEMNGRKAGWHISLTSLSEELSLGFVEYDDRIGLTSLIESLEDRESLLIRLALTHQKEARELTSRVLLRKLYSEGKVPNISLDTLKNLLTTNGLGYPKPNELASARIVQAGGLGVIELIFDHITLIAGIQVRIPERHNILGKRVEIKQTPRSNEIHEAISQTMTVRQTPNRNNYNREWLFKLAKAETRTYNEEFNKRNPPADRAAADLLAWKELFEQTIATSEYNIVSTKKGPSYNGCDYIVSAWPIEIWNSFSESINDAIDDNPFTAWDQSDSF